MNVLVTGGAGYIGSHICQLLAQEGLNPVTIDNLSTGQKEFVRWGTFYEGNIQDIPLVRRILATEKIDSVIHLAAFADVGESMRHPLAYYENNVVASACFISEVVKNKISNFIFSSTCAVYGESENSSVDETQPCRPMSVYGRTKLITEMMLNDLSTIHPLKNINLRYFNAAGATKNLGELRQPPIRIIPLAFKAAFESNFTLQVYGDQHKTPDGSCIRDYTHVEDIAKAHILALKKLFTVQQDHYTNTYNLGSGSGYSVFEIINAIEQITGQKVKHQIHDARPGDPSRVCSQFEKAKKELDWTPKHSDLKNIIGSYADWYLKELKPIPT